MTERLAVLLVVVGLGMALAARFCTRAATADALGSAEALRAEQAPAAVSADMPRPSVAAPDLGADPVGWAQDLYGAVLAGRWALVAGLALIGATYATRRWVLAGWQWPQTDRGGVAVAGAVALAGAICNALLAGVWPDGKTLVAALQVALVAMGGYTGVRKLLWPKPVPA